MAFNPTQTECRICGNESGNQLHQAREMFFGTRDPFTYIECANCGTLQIQTVPNLASYYSSDYYSFQAIEDKTGKAGIAANALRAVGSASRRSAADHYVGEDSLVSDFVYRQVSRFAPHLLVGFPDYLKQPGFDLKIDRDSKILDVGSGAGHVLISLSHFGFRNLTGIDPFIESDRVYDSGVRVMKTELSAVNDTFDLILSNHTIEHVPDPRATLSEIYRLLRPNRYAIVRMPVVSYAWTEYGTNWVQLDAPRHLFLFTAKFFPKLAADAGFEVKQTAYDSTAFQFWGSEQYRRDVPLLDERSYFVNPDHSEFTPEQIAQYTAEAERLNAREAGDQAVFYLHKGPA